jgi:hypothetical protein
MRAVGMGVPEVHELSGICACAMNPENEKAAQRAAGSVRFMIGSSHYLMKKIN